MSQHLYVFAIYYIFKINYTFIDGAVWTCLVALFLPPPRVGLTELNGIELLFSESSGLPYTSKDVFSNVE